MPRTLWGLGMIDCRIAEMRMKPLTQKPLLCIVVPTWNRLPEMVMAVESLASQIINGLEGRVEIIITDNASEPDCQSAIRALSDRFGSVSYVFHERNEGAAFQLFAACWRSRGEWTWTFGSDDVLLPGGLGSVVSKLEAEGPDFLSLNSRTYSADLSRQIYVPLLGCPDRRFDGFADLMCGVGFHQVTFISVCLERTSVARRIDLIKYLKIDTLFPQLFGYLEKHKNSKSVYWSKDLVVNRQHNSQAYRVDHMTQRDLGWETPIAIMELSQLYGIPDDFFEQINGDDRVSNFDIPLITFVDVMFKNMLLSIGNEFFMRPGQINRMKEILENCRPQRLQQFNNICEINKEAIDLYNDFDRFQTDLYNRKRALDTYMEGVRIKGRQWKKNQTC